MLFGNQEPKIVVSGSGITYNLDKVNVEKDYQPDIIEHQAIDGTTHFILNGDYYDFTVDIHLYDYANPKTTFESLHSLYINETKVQYYIHRDGYPLKDKDNNIVYFRITEFKPYELGEDESLFDKDMIKLKFSAINYVDICKSLI